MTIRRPRPAAAIAAAVALAACSPASPTAAPVTNSPVPVPTVALPTASPASAALVVGQVPPGRYSVMLSLGTVRFAVTEGWTAEIGTDGSGRLTRTLSDGTTGTIAVVPLTADGVYADACKGASPVAEDGTPGWEARMLGVLRGALGLEPELFPLDFDNNQAGVGFAHLTVGQERPDCDGAARKLWPTSSGESLEVPAGTWADLYFFRLGDGIAAVVVSSTTPATIEGDLKPAEEEIVDLGIEFVHLITIQ
jgi:hypothetical protein